jgi:hypothetical protein
MPTKLSNEVLLAAIEGFQLQKKQIDNRIAELRHLLNGSGAESASGPGMPIRKRKKFSAATRRRMKAAQQRRWAAVRRAAEWDGPPQNLTV